MEITVAIDCMGGDHGPHVTVPAALNFLKSNSDVDVVLVGLRDAIEAELKARGAKPGPRLRVHHASEVVLMDESPALALRNKKDSSIRVAVDLVKNGEAQACVSAGNTGALMAVSRFVLKMLPGIDRPAIIAALPSVRGTTYVSISAPTSIAGRSICCSSRSWGDAGRCGRAQGPAERRPAQHRRGGYQRQRGGEGGGGDAARKRASISSATSKATESTRGKPTW